MPFQVTFFLGVLPIEFLSPFAFLLLENVLKPVLSGKVNRFHAVPYELVAKLSAEMGVRTEVTVVVYPVKTILPDAVVCCLQVEPYGIIDIPGKDFKSC